jgi:hypothetical protein
MKNLISIELAKKLKELGIKQYATHSFSVEKQCIVSGDSKYHALDNDISVFTEEELFFLLQHEIEMSSLFSPITDLLQDYFDYLIVFENYVIVSKSAKIVANGFLCVEPHNDYKYYDDYIKRYFSDKTYYPVLGDYKSVDINIAKITLVQKLHKIYN